MSQQFTIMYKSGVLEHVSDFLRYLTRVDPRKVEPHRVYYVISCDLTEFYMVLGNYDDDNTISNEFFTFRFKHSSSVYMEDDMIQKPYFVYAMIYPIGIDNQIVDQWNEVISTAYVDGPIYYSLRVILGGIQDIQTGDFITQGNWNCPFYVSSIVHEENGNYILFNAENDGGVWDDTRPFTIIRLHAMRG
jgi:hypothetical protein